MNDLTCFLCGEKFTPPVEAIPLADLDIKFVEKTLTAEDVKRAEENLQNSNVMSPTGGFPHRYVGQVVTELQWQMKCPNCRLLRNK